MAGKTFSVTAILGVNSKRLAAGLKAAAMRMKAWAMKTMATVGRIVKQGMMIAGAAVAYFAYKSIKEFSSFEKGMNEVFTLLPGISKAAMGQMEEQALSLAKTMGVVPEEVIPALYQALSGGVPPKNVFEFMEAAVKASKAGVVDLNTAVDALTTVVNTYGAANITAAQAADIMFEAVKMGKTTFGEMAATMYNVLPIAKAADVAFADIAAATAAMTAKGTPTAQVMTQLKAAIQAIVAPSTRSAKWFGKYGLSIKELGRVMAGPGGLVKAMNMIKVATNGDMQAMRKLLGSVEAISAVLTLTSDGGQKFTEILEGMTTQSGQATTAFNRMDQGLARSFEKMMAAFKVAMIRFGKALAPLIHRITPAIMRIISAIENIPWAGLINGFARVWVIGLKPTFDAVAAAIGGLPWGNLYWFLLPIASLIIKLIQKIGKIIIGLSPAIIPAMKTIAGLFVLLYVKFILLVHFLSKIATQIGAVWREVFEIISSAMNFIIDPSAKKFNWLVYYIRDRFYMLGGAIRKLFGQVWKTIKGTLNQIFTGIGKGIADLVKTIFNKIGTLLSAIPGFNEAVASIYRTWVEIRQGVAGEVAALIDAFKSMFGGVQQNVKGTSMWQKALEWAGQSLGEILVLTMKFVQVLMKLVGMIIRVGVRLLTELAPALSKILPVAFKVAAAFVYFFIEGLKACIWMLTQVVKAILWLEPAFMLIVSIVAGFVAAVGEGVKAIWGIFNWLYKGIKEGIAVIFESFVEAFYKIKGVVKSVIYIMLALFKKLKDFVFEVLFGGTITKDFKAAFDYIEKVVMRVLMAVFEIFREFKKIASTVLEGIATAFETIFAGIAKVVRTLGKVVSQVFDAIGENIVKILGAFTAMAKVIKGIFGKVLDLGGKALDMAGKAAGAVGGAISSVGGLFGLGGGGGGSPAPVAQQITTGTLRTSLRPIVTKLDSIDGTLKSIDQTLKGKFVNQ